MFKLLLTSALLFFLVYGIFSWIGKHFGRNNNRYRDDRQQNNEPHVPQQDSKHFNDDVGEYVSYEEVKEDEK